MPDKKISALTELSSGNVADGDYLPIVDVSEAANADKNKRWTWSSIKADILSWLGFTATEASYLSGVTSAIQTQIDGKLANVVEDTTPQLGGDLDAQSNDITAVDNFKFGTNPTTPLTTEGSLYWDATNHTIAMKNDESDVTMQVGQELYVRVRNESGAAILNGEVVYQSGTEGAGEGRPLIGLALASAQSTSAVIGVATHDIENNSYGYVAPFGVINDLNTSSFSAGDSIYLSADTAGAFTNTAPTAPNYSILLGSVLTSNASTGNILVAVVPNVSSPAGDASELVITCRKGTAGTIAAGVPVYVTGYHSGSGDIEVEAADASSSVTMPALGITRASITNSAGGAIVFAGKLTGQDTSSWSVGDALYVSETTGTLTSTKPQGTALIQKVGTVLRSNISNGVIEISGAGRTNDLPNIANTKIWIGDSNGVPQEFALSGDATMTAGGVVTVKQTEAIGIACSDETTALTTGTGKVTFRMPYAFTLTEVRASVTTAPTGATITVDINESGTTILSTKLTIDVSEKTSETAAITPVISDSSLADDAEITIDIDQVGSTVAGAGLKVWLIGNRT